MARPLTLESLKRIFGLYDWAIEPCPLPQLGGYIAHDHDFTALHFDTLKEAYDYFNEQCPD